ncbi:hypothetical protein PMAYCL1PPCAC_29502 [Pristionchus mayeri]|uniref:FYVE-type domain-containing protein n=1 Tax=Pristionchus mayeri TaxID=1317129 RepID=A0AAN5IAW7_9BILA|nr:hypothetical protein PMAYCL1PPCAC_29502 [Pristionchus mayeri]
MPSSWSTLTPLLSVKRAFFSHQSKKGKKDSRSSPSPPPSISSPLPIQLSSPLSSSQSVPRFSRRDEQLRTRKYLNFPSTSPSQSISSPTVPRRSQSPSPFIPRRPITPTQAWPSASTLLEWMEPTLKERREEGRRMRTLSQGNLAPSRSSFYSSDTVLLPTRVRREEMDEMGRGTAERVAHWIRSKSKERVDRVEDWKRTNSDRRKRAPVLSSRSRSIDSFSYSMPAAAGCSNCCSKYSLLNREEGCSGCALSFCKRCVRWKAVVPRLSSNPLSVCQSCFERIEREEKEKQMKNYSYSMSSTPLYPSVPSSVSSQSTSYFHSRPIPSPHPSTHPLPPLPPPPPPYSPHPIPSSSSIYPSNLTRPWWNESDLPPPSMRSEYGKGVAQPRSLVKGIKIPSSSASPSSTAHPSVSHVSPLAPTHEMAEMEERAKKLRDDVDVPAPSLSSLEERLAALRGVDVELVRNPRLYLEKKGSEPTGDTVDKLMEEARSMAILEEQNDPDRLLEERANRLIERRDEGKKEEGTENEDIRLSMAPSVSSRMSELSEATKEELADIDRVMTEARSRVEEAEGRLKREKGEEGREDDVTRQMGEANKLATQLSLDVAKVNEELAAFWQKENGKRSKERSLSSEEELDEETLAAIVREAEDTPDVSLLFSRRFFSSCDAICRNNRNLIDLFALSTFSSSLSVLSPYLFYFPYLYIRSCTVNYPFYVGTTRVMGLLEPPIFETL